MDQSEFIINQITKSAGRKSLYHFTRARNLKGISTLDTLYSANRIDPMSSVQRRTDRRVIELNGHLFTINAHLRIANSLIDSSTTQLEFREYLDQHVFLWPTLRDVQAMINTYSRREPEESFVILKFDASSLLLNNFNSIKLSKYDSGSSPRYPNNCSYKKSPKMFLPLEAFGIIDDSLIPTKPSEIKEVLASDQLTNLTQYLQAVYCEHEKDVPERWKAFWEPHESANN
ncbi:hypothetical protein EHS13_07390 [Paenibacillus psychroresistens]|uniref:DUF4433 domain-containing protein n=1 Tax=Paenibacillus psychroresistens TaxID=1778678 RepID=A0A6B8RGR1_9BACL|nr:hypothetical protein [Paenibacillus psychroresistens]QGQ94722.1 hypothetical protein EHS13_07390 [Paenibacillus psychroresistens]